MMDKELIDRLVSESGISMEPRFPGTRMYEFAALIAEHCAQLVEGNRLLSGSFGPLMNVGWGMANESSAQAIRARFAA